MVVPAGWMDAGRHRRSRGLRRKSETLAPSDCEGAKACGFLRWGVPLGGSSWGSFCATVLWINCFIEQGFWDSAAGNLIWLCEWGVWGPSGLWSTLLWRDFDHSSGSLWHWECDHQRSSWMLRLGSLLKNSYTEALISLIFLEKLMTNLPRLSVDLFSWPMNITYSSIYNLSWAF